MRGFIVAAGLAVLATACSEAKQETPPPAQRSESAQTAVTGLCEAESLASGGGRDEARAVYEQESKSYLEDLATQTRDQDPSLAAELLEAKRQVERALQAGDPELVTGLLGQLRAVVESALAKLGMANVGCFK
jgi:hypothetical protein